MKKSSKIFSVLLIILLTFTMYPLSTNAVVTTQENEDAWNTHSTSSNTLFYLDYQNNYSKITNSQAKDYSLAVSNPSSGTSTSKYFKTISVQPNTDYVLNAMVKSTFINSNKTMPVKLVAHSGNGSFLTQSLSSFGGTNEWQEISLGFNSGNYNVVTLSLLAEFNQSGTVWFDNVRVDKPSTMNVLFLAYSGLDATDQDGNRYINTSEVPISQINTAVSELSNLVKEITNYKIKFSSDISEPGILRRIHSSPEKYYPTYDDVKQDVLNAEHQNNKVYDVVYVVFPSDNMQNNRYPFLGVYNGVIDGKAFINVSEGLFNVVTSEPHYNARYDGLLHEFVHHLERLSRDSGRKQALDFPSSIDHYESQIQDEQEIKYNVVVNNKSYENYLNYYQKGLNLKDTLEDTSFDSSTKNYTEYYNSTTSPAYQNFNVKYQWYYDVINGQLQHYSGSGFYGFKSEDLLHDGSESVYHMNTNLIEDGIYNLDNLRIGYTNPPRLNENNTSLSLVTASTSIDQQWQFKCINGYYEITPISNPNKRLTVSDIGTGTDTGSVSISDHVGGDSQKWLISKLSNGVYIISTKLDPSKCFEYSYGGNPNKAQLWKYVSSSPYNNQKWNIIKSAHPINNGFYNLKNLEYTSNPYLSNDSSGLNLRTSDVDPFYQNWKFTCVGAGYYEITPISNLNKRLTVSDIGTGTDTGSVSISDYVGNDSQKWIISKLSNGVYIISSKLDPSKCFEYSYGGNPNKAQLWKYVPSSQINNQKWDIPASNINNKGIYGSLTNCYSSYSTKYLGYDLKLTTTEKTWAFELDADGYCAIYPLTNRTSALTVSALENGSAVSMSSYSNSDYQKWLITRLDNGNFKITSKLDPNKCLEYSYGGSIFQAQLWTYVGEQNPEKNQEWTLQ